MGSIKCQVADNRPDLLAALKLATQWVPTDAMFYSENTHGERIYTKDVINQAIAKAEGRS